MAIHHLYPAILEEMLRAGKSDSAWPRMLQGFPGLCPDQSSENFLKLSVSAASEEAQRSEPVLREGAISENEGGVHLAPPPRGGSDDGRARDTKGGAWRDDWIRGDWG